MADIKCKACGRRYSYHTSDLCPRCGAYNKPQSRMRVDFDKNGSAELLNEQQFQQRSQANRKSRVCYEQKECHEDAVRVSEKEPESGWVNDLLEGFSGDEMKNVLNKAKSWSGSLFRTKKGEEQTAVGILAAVMLLLPLLLRACAF